MIIEESVRFSNIFPCHPQSQIAELYANKKNEILKYYMFAVLVDASVVLIIKAYSRDWFKACNGEQFLNLRLRMTRG